MRSIVIDQKSIEAISSGQLELESVWANLSLPASTSTTKCTRVGDHGYILSRQFQPADAMLVISLADDGPLQRLSPSSRELALSRVFKCTSLFIMHRSRSIPMTWRPFHSNNRLSIQADRISRRTEGGRTEAGRIVLETSQDVGPRVFAYYLDQEGERDINASKFEPDRQLFESALDGVPLALTQKELPPQPDTLGNELALDGSLPPSERTHSSYRDWYQVRLTKAQRSFVDYPLPGSVRLVGPAGSGKTVALVVKCLMELHKAAKLGESKRFLFLTHASSTAAAIQEMVQNMDPEEGVALLASDRAALTVTTLNSLANDHMRYNLVNLTPVSLDGHEGRVFQADVLNEVIEEFQRGDWITFKSKCSPPFVSYIQAAKDSPERRFFLWELLNEFACVLDAEGVRTGSDRREQYLTEKKRRAWMMMLDNRDERDVVLHLYDGFRAWLRSTNAIGSDQMISDFISHLDSYRWEATRLKEGYNVVFVDELHLFNRQERLTFQLLLRDPNNTPSVLLAYDAKQSPRDSFLGLPSTDAKAYDLWKDARLGKVDKIELVDVFRYTPQIAKALKCIDQSFPGQDLDEEWPPYKGIARTKDGPIPIACTLESTMAVYTTVFERAKNMQRSLGKSGRVALLCASNALFKRFLDFGDYKDYYYAVTSRDDAAGIPVSVRKFVFSAPEYVAGLQFDTVLLIEVNQDEVPEGPYMASAKRKFASQVYLGASRAERRLEIYASTEHGGIASLVSQAVLVGALETKKKHELPPE